MKDNKLWNRIVRYLAVASGVIALLEGYFYFRPLHPAVWPVHAIQNATKAYFFQAEITAGAAYDALQGVEDPFHLLVGYAYILVILVAPLCTATAVYRAIERFLRYRLNSLFDRRRRVIALFGCNESSLKLLKTVTGEQRKNARLLLVSDKAFGKEEELEILRRGAEPVSVAGLDAESRARLYRKKLFAYRECHVILLHEATGENLSEYFRLLKQAEQLQRAPEMYYYCSCADRYGARLLEDYYHNRRQTEALPELRTFHMAELSAERVLREHPLTTFQQTHGWADKNLHLLIVGFGTLGSQLTLHAVSQGVFSSDSRILIDVVDHEPERSLALFSKNFRSDYATVTGDTLTIGSDKSDGLLTIRFHSADIEHSRFIDTLESICADMPVTYAAVTLPNDAAALQAVTDIREVCLCRGGGAVFPLGVRLSADSGLADMLCDGAEGLFVIENPAEAVTLDDILQDTGKEQILRYNWVYNQISLSGAPSAPGLDLTEGDLPTMKAAWQRMALFQQNATRLLFCHADVKNALLADPDTAAGFHRAVGEDGAVVRRQGGAWLLYGDDGDFLRRLADNPALEELLKTEHRRWCYALASMGWTYAPGGKDLRRKQNPCLCTWTELCRTRPDMCKYDLIPYLVEFS